MLDNLSYVYKYHEKGRRAARGPVCGRSGPRTGASVDGGSPTAGRARTDAAAGIRPDARNASESEHARPIAPWLTPNRDRPSQRVASNGAPAKRRGELSGAASKAFGRTHSPRPKGTVGHPPPRSPALRYVNWRTTRRTAHRATRRVIERRLRVGVTGVGAPSAGSGARLRRVPVAPYSSPPSAASASTTRIAMSGLSPPNVESSWSMARTLCDCADGTRAAPIGGSPPHPTRHQAPRAAVHRRALRTWRAAPASVPSGGRNGAARPGRGGRGRSSCRRPPARARKPTWRPRAEGPPGAAAAPRRRSRATALRTAARRGAVRAGVRPA